MTIELDHTIVPSRHAARRRKRSRELLDVPWSAKAPLGPFSPVYVNGGLTLDFIDTDEAFPIYHFAFRVERSAVRRDPRPVAGRRHQVSR